jgi:glycosyltransferase involved in cell wall biosynthesis
MNVPKISIGLPVYNGENFLREAILSVLNQSCQDFELIIRDNASTDKTEEISREFANRDARIRYIRNETNVGAGPNFNSIVALARGQYFKWLAHDDIMAPTFLERCLEFLEKDPSAVLAYPRVRYIDAQGQSQEDYVSRFPINDGDPVLRFAKMIRPGHRCFEVFGLIRLDKLRQTRLIGCYNHGDGVLLAHLALLGRFAEVPENLLCSRRHDKQSMYMFGVAYRKAIPDYEAYANWFDPKNRVGLSRSFNKALVDYLHMTRRSPLSSAQRLACYRIVGRWFLSCWRGIAGEWKRAVFHACGIRLKSRQSSGAGVT